MHSIKMDIFDPVANPSAVVSAGKARFTVLKSRLLRIEYDPFQQFEDRPSQVFWYRNQPVPIFRTWKEGDQFFIETEDLKLRYNTNEAFHWRHLDILIKSTGIIWKYGDRDNTNLGGTRRTLDSINGAAPIEQGLISRVGWSIIDDTNSLVFDETGWLIPRESNPDYKDFYFCGYAQDYLGAIQEYQHISGRPGLIPRWALGNWWSRYWTYTQMELTELMNDFSHQQIPLSVCIVDMDWHLTQTGNASSGWTGYTWNRSLFPEPEKFIDNLHSLNLRTALNLHPAEGVHDHEEAYPQMAAAMGVDPKSKKPIEFDIASKEFTRHYFELLHYPLEAQGIDFWWLDWQQGVKSKTEGLDPLFWLNHLHYFDLGRNPLKRSFIFSRWPGLGGHRYPIGFSGDTVVSWESLDFQPYFTATAANVAFGWWSHDIGGHCEGIEDSELYLRWVQYGVFSPILRLHSTNNPWCERRPWGYDETILKHTRDAMQLRHALVPLLYTANYRNAKFGEPAILPMYYDYPEHPHAYSCPQQYLYCQQLVAAPFTRPMEPDTKLSRQTVWLPKGNWYRFDTGEYYSGGFWYAVYGDLGDIPVFAKAGSILPMAADVTSNGTDNPDRLIVRIFAGDSGHFELYEDDGTTQAFKKGQYSLTRFSLMKSSDGFTVIKHAVSSSFPGMPSNREYQFEFIGFTRPQEITFNGKPLQLSEVNGLFTTPWIQCAAKEELAIILKGSELSHESLSLEQRVRYFIDHAKLPSLVKQTFMRRLPELILSPDKIWDITHEFTRSQLLALFESVFLQQEEPIARDVETAYDQMMFRIRNLI